MSSSNLVVFRLPSCDLRAQNCNCLVVSYVVIGPVIVCKCIVLVCKTNRATHEQIRMAFPRSHFRIISSSWSSAIADTLRSSFTMLASACVSSVDVVTIFSGHLAWYGSHDGPCHLTSEHLLIFPPRFYLILTCLHWRYSFPWIFRTRLLQNCL